MTIVTAVAQWLADSGWWNGHAGWHHGWWWIWMLLVWALLIVLVVVLLRGPRQPSRMGDPARTILAERYARGEIAPDEYRERLEMLKETEGR
jgi:putative membrane protein